MANDKQDAGKAKDMVLDGETGRPVDSIPEASWDDLCEAPPLKELVLEFPAGRKKVAYRPFISLERQIALSDRYNMGNAKRRNSKGYMVAVLKEVLVVPRIETAAHERLVLKARSDLLLQVLSDSVGSDSEEMEALREDLNP